MVPESSSQHGRVAIARRGRRRKDDVGIDVWKFGIEIEIGVARVRVLPSDAIQAHMQYDVLRELDLVRRNDALKLVLRLCSVVAWLPIF